MVSVLLAKFDSSTVWAGSTVTVSVAPAVQAGPANCRAVEELCFGQKGEVEIVYGDGPWGRGQRRMSSD